MGKISLPDSFRRSILVSVTVIGALLLSTAAQAQNFDITPLAEKKVSQLPPGLLFWRIDTFPTLAKAQAVASPTALAAEVAGKAWRRGLENLDNRIGGISA